MVQPIKTRVSAGDYFQSSDYAQADLIQLIDGEVVLSMPPTPQHQAIVGAILFLLMTIARQKGGRAFTSPIEVYLDEHNVFEPDVLYLTPDSACKVDAKRLIGAPDLVVEVLSLSTAKVDRQTKYQAYQRHGVREYWIVDPIYETIEIYTQSDGQFIPQGTYAGDDDFQSRTLGENIALKAIFDG